MSGFAGRFSLDGGPVTPDDVRRMAAAGPQTNAVQACVQASFGVASAGADQTLASRAGVIAAFDGRLDNRSELALACGPAVPDPDDSLTDAALVLAAYERFGDECAAQLNGDFALALFDARREHVLLARDVMSARSLYYAAVPGALLFATTIKSLLADPGLTAAPDADGLAALVLDNWCDDRRTCFKDVFSVPAGHVLVRTRDRERLHAHWTFDPGRTIRYGTFAEYCEAFRSLFAQSVRRRLRTGGRVAVAVSGGVDSSSIFCQAAALLQAQAPAALRGVALTFPPESGAAETAFLEQVERASDVPILKIAASEYRFLDNADAAVRQLECPIVVAHTEAALLETARDAGCRVMLNGFFGDQMLADRGYLVDLARAGRWRKIRHDVREFHAWMPDAGAGFFEQDLRSRLIRGLPPRWAIQLGKRTIGRWRERRRYPPWFAPAFRRRAAVRARRGDVPARGVASEHARQYYLHVTAGYYAHAVRCDRALGAMYGIDVRHPFRDRDLVSFLMAVPGDIVNWQGVPKGLLRHALAGVVPDAILGRRGKADFTAVENQSLRRAHGDLVRLLPDDCLAVRRGFVDAPALRASLRTFTSGDDADGVLPGWHLTDVAGLELWLRSFFGGAGAAATRDG